MVIDDDVSADDVSRYSKHHNRHKHTLRNRQTDRDTQTQTHTRVCSTQIQRIPCCNDATRL